MPKTRKHVCIVCGRVFPEGQGIVIERAGVKLAFHSKTCLTRFFKLFIERIDEKEFKRVTRELLRELEEARKLKAKAKVI